MNRYLPLPKLEEGSFGFDDKMDPGCKDQPLNDNVPKDLVKLDDTMSSEDNISDYKLDETVVGGVIVHRATLQEAHQTDKVDAALFVDVSCSVSKKPSLIDNVERSLKKETSTLGEIVSLNYIKSNKNVIGLRKSN
ncbi:hypothetical protein Tco_1457339 [Tanacetum coccineum]